MKTRWAILAALLGLVGLVSCAARKGDDRSPLTAPPPPPAEQTETGAFVVSGEGATVELPTGVLSVHVCQPHVVRVQFAQDSSSFSRETLATEVRQCSSPSFSANQDEAALTLRTDALRVRIEKHTGRVSFMDLHGKPILEESPLGRTLMPAEVMGETTHHVGQKWEPEKGEALYGLGENQSGIFDLVGRDLELWQHNGVIVVPYLVSSRGWGILWNNTSFTKFGDRRDYSPIPSDRLLDADGQVGGLTGSYYQGGNFERLVGKRIDRNVHIQLPGRENKANSLIYPGLAEGAATVRWEGFIEPELTGIHSLQVYYNGTVRLWIDDELLVDHYRQFWLPWKDFADVELQAGTRHRIRLEWVKDQSEETVQLSWKPPLAGGNALPKTQLWSEVGEGIDYTFVYGPSLDRVVSGYREVTGHAPMIPRWALGLWQSRQRYKTAKESLDVVREFRKRKIPFDNIVQDWFYWKEDQWGSHEFDPERFPDVDEWLRELHAANAHVMISVWPKFYPGTDNYEQMRARGFLYHRNIAEGVRDWVGQGYPYTFYDAFDEEAGKLFWSQIKESLYDKGFDAFWMDASEPDLTRQPTLAGQRAYMHPTALGSGARMLNAYPLYNTKTVYEGQRKANPDERVFILTRSGFAGQQRYGAAVWSGDITSTWSAMRQQIPAGLSMSLSGIPYWTMDVGGFSVPARFSKWPRDPADEEEWRELNTRWFQIGTFVPLLRAHGEYPNREMWELGGEEHQAYQTHLKFDRIRYRLLPYIYSLAAEVTHDGKTMMRPLVMDFPSDPSVLSIDDQYLFGEALLVSPVTTHLARERAVYLPKSDGWYDFWTGKGHSGGKTITAPAPYDAIPLHVRAGSIVPMGPELTYTDEKPADPITLWVYEGADGRFVLYEDDGVTHAYERGELSRIPIGWNDDQRVLILGKREGSFPQMLQERKFEIVLVSHAHPVGFSFAPKPVKTVVYDGEKQALRF